MSLCPFCGAYSRRSCEMEDEAGYCAWGAADDADEADNADDEPCTERARRAGCTCRMETVNSASIDPPEPIVDPWCLLHGRRDPDRERDEARDDAIYFGDEP